MRDGCSFDGCATECLECFGLPRLRQSMAGLLATLALILACLVVLQSAAFADPRLSIERDGSSTPHDQFDRVGHFSTDDTVILEYTIKNGGSSALSVTGVRVDTDATSNASVSTPTVGETIATEITAVNDIEVNLPPDEKTIRFTFSPIAAGAFGFDLVVESDDPDVGSYVVKIIGTAHTPAPELTVRHQGVVIYDGDYVVLANNGQPEAEREVKLRIENTEETPLTISDLSFAEIPGVTLRVSGSKEIIRVIKNLKVRAGETEETYVATYVGGTIGDLHNFRPFQIAAGATATITIGMRGALISRSFAFHIDNDGTPDGRHTINVIESELGQKLKVTRNDGDQVTDIGHGTTDDHGGQWDFWPVTVEYTLENTSPAGPLEIHDIRVRVQNRAEIREATLMLSGGERDAETVNRGSPLLVHHGTPVRLKITYIPKSPAGFGIDLAIHSNSYGASPYRFQVTGTTLTSSLDIIGENGRVVYPDEDYRIGNVVSDTDHTVEFKIANSGNESIDIEAIDAAVETGFEANLTINSETYQEYGSNSWRALSRITSESPRTIKGGEYLTVRINYTPTGEGEFQGKLTVTELGIHDTIQFIGRGVVSNPTLLVKRERSTIDDGDTDTLADHLLGEQISRKYSVRNPGKEPLIITTLQTDPKTYGPIDELTLDGRDASRIKANAPVEIGPGGSAVLDLKFTPTGQSNYTFDINMKSNDPAAQDFGFTIEGGVTTPIR